MQRFRSRSSSPQRSAFASILVILVVVGLATPSWATPGAVVWTARSSGIDTYPSSPANVVSPDGTKVFVTGWGAYGIYNGLDYVVTAYNTMSGAPIWTKYYNGPADLDDFAGPITISPDGSKVFVTGNSEYRDSCSCMDYATVAFNATSGAKLWTQRYHSGTGPSVPVAIATSSDGAKVFVTGRGWSSIAGWDYVTVAYDAATGATSWTRRYNGNQNARDEPSDLAVSPDGTKVFVTGSSSLHSPFSGDFVTIAYSATNGTPVWARRYDSAGSDGLRALTASNTKVFVTGLSGGPGGAWNSVTVAYAASTGFVAWTTTSATYWVMDIGVSPDGSKVFITGGNFDDYLTTAHNSTSGALLWSARYDGPAHRADLPIALAVSPNGARVYVTGSSEGTTSCGGGHPYCYDYATIAYGAGTGTVGWTSRYDGPVSGEDSAKAISVSPGNARVYVTGASEGFAPGAWSANEYATVAYSAT